MSKIMWDTPAKRVQNREELGSFDGGPVGGYVPNMSKEDAERWRGKHINAGKDNARIELRKTFNNAGINAQVLVIMALDGWTYNRHEKPYPPKRSESYHHDVSGMNVRISTNGPMVMTFDDWDEMKEVIAEARELLQGE